jgi:hypothetical protein
LYVWFWWQRQFRRSLKRDVGGMGIIGNAGINITVRHIIDNKDTTEMKSHKPDEKDKSGKVVPRGKASRDTGKVRKVRMRVPKGKETA